MPMKYQTLALLSFVLLLACDDSPTGPGDELVGTWVLVSATGSEGIGSILVLRANGTFRLSFEVEGIEISLTGSWEIVGDKLIAVFDPVGGEVRTTSEEYTLRGNRLTLVDNISGSVEIWERRK